MYRYLFIMSPLRPPLDSRHKYRQSDYVEYVISWTECQVIMYFLSSGTTVSVTSRKSNVPKNLTSNLFVGLTVLRITSPPHPTAHVFVVPEVRFCLVSLSHLPVENCCPVLVTIGTGHDILTLWFS